MNIIIGGELEKLFNNWKKLHKSKENFEKTTPKALIYSNNPTANKSAFIEDGIISPEHYQGKILFILKESNERQTCDKEQPIGHKNQIQDWFYKDNIEKNKLCSFMRKMANISNSINEVPCSDIEALKQVAYMNINKRGGYNSTKSTKILENYASQYKQEIMKEIEILNPDYVLCCGLNGKSVFDILKDDVYDGKDCDESSIDEPGCFIKKIKDKITLFIRLPHLSARGDYAKTIESFPHEFPKLVKQFSEII